MPSSFNRIKPSFRKLGTILYDIAIGRKPFTNLPIYKKVALPVNRKYPRPMHRRLTLRNLSVIEEATPSQKNISLSKLRKRTYLWSAFVVTMLVMAGLGFYLLFNDKKESSLAKQQAVSKQNVVENKPSKKSGPIPVPEPSDFLDPLTRSSGQAGGGAVFGRTPYKGLLVTRAHTLLTDQGSKTGQVEFSRPTRIDYTNCFPVRQIVGRGNNTAFRTYRGVPVPKFKTWDESGKSGGLNISRNFSYDVKTTGYTFQSLGFGLVEYQICEVKDRQRVSVDTKKALLQVTPETKAAFGRIDYNYKPLSYWKTLSPLKRSWRLAGYLANRNHYDDSRSLGHERQDWQRRGYHLFEILGRDNNRICKESAWELANKLRLTLVPSRIVLGYVPDQETGLIGPVGHAAVEALINGRVIALDSTPIGVSTIVKAKRGTAYILERLLMRDWETHQQPHHQPKSKKKRAKRSNFSNRGKLKWNEFEALFKKLVPDTAKGAWNEVKNYFPKK